jgi:hypothetical protein
MLLLNKGEVRVTPENEVETLDYSEISFISFDSSEKNPLLTRVTYEQA